MGTTIVEKVCRIPTLLRDEQDKSFADHVKDSGYLERPDALNVDDVAAHLRAHPDLVESWLTYSGDKRSSPGWYFSELRDRRYEVGYFPGGTPREFSDAASACAEFIRRELWHFASGSRGNR